MRQRWIIPLAAALGLLALAQDGLPGLQDAGDYQQGERGAVTQSAPPELSADSVYSVGAYPLHTPELADGEGADQVRSYCSICHSTTYITMQPPLPAATWEAEVNKMIGTFGAPIPDDAAHAIIGYLQAHYTPDTRQQ